MTITFNNYYNIEQYLPWPSTTSFGHIIHIFIQWGASQSFPPDCPRDILSQLIHSSTKDYYIEWKLHSDMNRYLIYVQPYLIIKTITILSRLLWWIKPKHLTDLNFNLFKTERCAPSWNSKTTSKSAGWVLICPPPGLFNADGDALASPYNLYKFLSNPNDHFTIWDRFIWIYEHFLSLKSDNKSPTLHS